jgi:hypothetical protein
LFTFSNKSKNKCHLRENVVFNFGKLLKALEVPVLLMVHLSTSL